MPEIYTKIVGVTFSNENGDLRQDIIESLEAEFGSEKAFPLRFQHQPDHPEDENAIAIFGPHSRQIGFIRRKLAAEIAPMLQRGFQISGEATTITGTELITHCYGINIRIELEPPF